MYIITVVSLAGSARVPLLPVILPVRCMLEAEVMIRFTREYDIIPIDERGAILLVCIRLSRWVYEAVADIIAGSLPLSRCYNVPMS